LAVASPERAPAGGNEGSDGFRAHLGGAAPEAAVAREELLGDDDAGAGRAGLSWYIGHARQSAREARVGAAAFRGSIASWPVSS
jgi:hypothetical protein